MKSWEKGGRKDRRAPKREKKTEEGIKKVIGTVKEGNSKI